MIRNRWDVPLMAFAALFALAPPLAAQRPVGPGSDTAAVAAREVADSASERSGPAPPRAFVRSLLVPGWGQASHRAYLRGGVYFAAQTASGFMLIKTVAKLAEAREIQDRRLGFVRDSLLRQAESDPVLADELSDPESLAAAVEADSLVQDIRELAGSREQQREDWIAWVLFWTLASGIDAFITAHLADFPSWLTARADPRSGVRFQVTLPAGGPP